MERLNDIMTRSTQRRQQQAPDTSEQRRPAPQQARRPLAEQAQRGSQYQQSPRSGPRVSETGTYDYTTQRGYRPPAYEGGDAASGYRPPAPSQRLPRYPLDAQRQPEEQPRPSRLTGDYYERNAPAPNADVQEHWDDDVAGMVDGDWEGEEATDISPYAQEATRQPHARYGYQSTAGAFAAQGPDPLATRQLQRMNEQERAAPPPAPRSPLTPPRLVQRHTQPLNPRTVSRMSQGLPHPPSPSQEPPRIQQPSRQVVLRQPMQPQVQQPAQSPAPSLPRPHGVKSVCPKCRGAGYLRLDVPFGHPNFGKPIPCECKEAERREKRRHALLELSDLSNFKDKTFENFNPRFAGIHPSVLEAFKEAYSFAQEPDGWLLLIGPNGCGKTHLAASVANYLFQDGAVVLFSVVPDLLAQLRATFAPSATEAYDQRFAKMREAELLVLDDLGAHQSSPWASEKLFQLLNYRYNSRYPTVITANRQGLSTIDERIQSRLSDIGLVTPIVMDGARDFRRQNYRQ